MRIIAGELGGRRINAPPGSKTRPTTDRVREALYSRVTSRLGSLQDIAALDLFAGSGALGLEALSRGAATCTLVERDRRCGGVIRENIRALGLGSRARLLTMDAAASLDLLAREGARFDLILADPPYALDPASLLERLGDLDLIAAGGLLSLEHGKGRAMPDPPPGLTAAGSKRYGDSVLSLYTSCI